MARLTGTTQPVALGGGYSLLAPGVRGNAELKFPRSAEQRSRSRTVDDGTAELDAALAGADVTEVRQIDLSVQPAPVASGSTLRSVDGRQDALELIVPDLGSDVGQLVLACDESGVLTWHLPLDGNGALETPATRGGGGTKRFRIPATPTTPAPDEDSQNRGLLSVVGRKLLKVLVYPITDPLIGAVSEFFAERWEGRKRPYRLRDFTPTNYRDPIAPELGPADWTRLAAGRALLFVHGTFSTSHSAFSQIPDATFAQLHARYGGRVFAFDHFTLSHDPAKNVRWLVDHLPALDLDLDIVCHSRGGLVARTLAERPAALGLGAPRVRVGKIVFVGVPNAGTLLAQPDHMVKMIDRLTTALNLFPSGPVGEVLEAILTAIKVIGHGALKGLDGLASMAPSGEFLTRINSGNPSGGGYYAIGADYEPRHPGLKALVAGTIADAVLDRVFGETPNDLVVPEPGVFAVEGCGAFPIPAQQLLRVPADAGVIHTTLFGHPPVSARLLQWLGA